MLKLPDTSDLIDILRFESKYNIVPVDKFTELFADKLISLIFLKSTELLFPLPYITKLPVVLLEILFVVPVIEKIKFLLFKSLTFPPVLYKLISPEFEVNTILPLELLILTLLVAIKLLELPTIKIPLVVPYIRSVEFPNCTLVEFGIIILPPVVVKYIFLFVFINKSPELLDDILCEPIDVPSNDKYVFIGIITLAAETLICCRVDNVKLPLVLSRILLPDIPNVIGILFEI